MTCVHPKIGGPDIYGFFECLRCGARFRDPEGRIPYWKAKS